MFRAIRWLVGSRILQRPVVMSFANNTLLLMAKGSPGATLNLYGGLHEYEEMAFVCHALRPGDTFVDIGANVGSYSILAAGVAGANVIAFEPIARTFESLLDNVNINRLTSLITAHNSAVGAEHGEIDFIHDQGPQNRVAAVGDCREQITRIPVVRLDDVLREIPAVVKIDVEGWEAAVVTGALSVLAQDGLLALIVELNGSGSRYGFSEADLRAKIASLGFVRAKYYPSSRRLTADSERHSGDGNQLYVKNFDRVQSLVTSAEPFVVGGKLV
jgi:FkbM family methyltransferase